MAMTDYLENKVLDHIFNNTSYTSPTATYIGLLTAAPTDSTSGTEMTNTGYSRQSISVGTSSAGTVTSDTAISWTNSSGGDWDTARALGIYDASTGGNLLFYKLISGRNVKDGETLTIASGDLTVNLD